MPVVLVVGLAGLKPVHVPPVMVKVELVGNLSLPETLVVLETPGTLLAVSSTASITSF